MKQEKTAVVGEKGANRMYVCEDDWSMVKVTAEKCQRPKIPQTELENALSEEEVVYNLS